MRLWRCVVSRVKMGRDILSRQFNELVMLIEYSFDTESGSFFYRKGVGVFTEKGSRKTNGRLQIVLFTSLNKIK